MFQSDESSRWPDANPEWDPLVVDGELGRTPEPAVATEERAEDAENDTAALPDALALRAAGRHRDEDDEEEESFEFEDDEDEGVEDDDEDFLEEDFDDEEDDDFEEFGDEEEEGEE